MPPLAPKHASAELIGKYGVRAPGAIDLLELTALEVKADS